RGDGAGSKGGKRRAGGEEEGASGLPGEDGRRPVVLQEARRFGRHRHLQVTATYSRPRSNEKSKWVRPAWGAPTPLWNGPADKPYGFKVEPRARANCQ